MLPVWNPGKGRTGAKACSLTLSGKGHMRLGHSMDILTEGAGVSPVARDSSVPGKLIAPAQPADGAFVSAWCGDGLPMGNLSAWQDTMQQGSAAKGQRRQQSYSDGDLLRPHLQWERERSHCREKRRQGLAADGTSHARACAGWCRPEATREAPPHHGKAVWACLVAKRRAKGTEAQVTAAKGCKHLHHGWCLESNSTLWQGPRCRCAQ